MADIDWLDRPEWETLPIGYIGACAQALRDHQIPADWRIEPAAEPGGGDHRRRELSIIVLQDSDQDEDDWFDRGHHWFCWNEETGWNHGTMDGEGALLGFHQVGDRVLPAPARFAELALRILNGSATHQPHGSPVTYRRTGDNDDLDDDLSEFPEDIAFPEIPPLNPAGPLGRASPA